MRRLSTRPKIFRELTQGALTGNLCGLFIDKNRRKTRGVRRKEKKQVSSRGGSEPPSEERKKQRRERSTGEVTY